MVDIPRDVPLLLHVDLGDHDVDVGKRETEDNDDDDGLVTALSSTGGAAEDSMIRPQNSKNNTIKSVRFGDNVHHDDATGTSGNDDSNNNNNVIMDSTRSIRSSI